MWFIVENLKDKNFSEEKGIDRRWSLFLGCVTTIRMLR